MSIPLIKLITYTFPQIPFGLLSFFDRHFELLIAGVQIGIDPLPFP
jgi:hypothetical protein